MTPNENIRIAGDPSQIELIPEGYFDSIAKRAYFMYLKSAGGDGHDMDHWLVAEMQTNQERRRRKL